MAPYPNNPKPLSEFDVHKDMDLTGTGLVWYARPQLFFHCSVCPTGGMSDMSRHLELCLVFFSTFEPINPTPRAVMQTQRVPMFYDSASSSSEPCLYLCPAENVLGRVPLMPCFIAGNSAHTLPHGFGNISGAVQDSRPNAGNGSKLYELHLWMWRYGRGQPRKGAVSDSEEARKARVAAARAQAAATRKRRRESRAQRRRRSTERHDSESSTTSESSS